MGPALGTQTGGGWRGYPARNVWRGRGHRGPKEARRESLKGRKPRGGCDRGRQQADQALV